MRIAPFGRFLAVSMVCACLAGCPEDTVTHSRVERTEASSPSNSLPAKSPPGAPPAVGVPAPHSMEAPAAAPPAPPPSMAGDVPAPPKPVGGSAVAWTLPKGWTQTLTGGIRYATLKAPVTGNLDASVVVLAGPAGGELANVNRWRGQIGLPPLTQEALPSARKSVNSKLGPVTLYDFTGEGTQKSRVVAGLASIGENTWFFKMTGDAD